MVPRCGTRKSATDDRAQRGAMTMYRELRGFLPVVVRYRGRHLRGARAAIRPAIPRLREAVTGRRFAPSSGSAGAGTRKPSCCATSAGGPTYSHSLLPEPLQSQASAPRLGLQPGAPRRAFAARPGCGAPVRDRLVASAGGRLPPRALLWPRVGGLGCELRQDGIQVADDLRLQAAPLGGPRRSDLRVRACARLCLRP